MTASHTEIQNSPLVSIIVPSYNVQNYIAEALDSIVEQSYSNWECIIVDDHSTDETTAIIKAYLTKLPDKFRFFENPGKGACSARNYRLKMASGNYIKFLDSDDAIFDIDTLHDQVGFLSANGLDVVYGREYYYVDKFEESNLKKTRGAELNEANIDKFFFLRFPITSNFLLKIPVGFEIKWSEILLSGQEFHFLFCCYLNGLKFGYQHKPAAKIRIHNSVSRISNKSPKVYVEQTSSLIKQMSSELEEKKINNNDFLLAFNIWKLRWSFSALRVRNFKVFKEIQSVLISPKALNIENRQLGILYKFNFFSPYLAFVCYETLKKIIKKDPFREN